VGPVDGLLKVKHPLKIPFTSAASRLPLFGVFFFVAGRSPTRYDGRNPAGWMASSSRMRLGRRPKDDDPHKECALTGSETGAYRSGVGHRSARFRAYTAVLPKIPHSNCCQRVPNRPLRGRRGRFGTLLQLLECGVFGRTAICRGDTMPQ